MTTTDTVPATFRRARPSDLAGLAAGAGMDLSAVCSLAAEGNLHLAVRRYQHHALTRARQAGPTLTGFEARRILERKADPVPALNMRRLELLELRRKGW
ncbi:hypothetical protein [Streptomyces sp. N50]|uniref:hypothetical protein n=1 Tax=Streptomyces sp. N50 TaxID=3081765 RepID=UPI00296218BE|nr:hypothetical protein [Streptomyces sp. N50]WOX09169.1 hypothetical protein R2B38_09845 [Streptomyces sp. N50]